MDRESREAIRQVAERYGVDQGDIVNMAPALFTLLAEHALSLRRQALPQLKTLIEQAQQNIRAIPSLGRHLRSHAEAISAVLDELYNAEVRAIAQCNLSGNVPDDDEYHGLNRLERLIGDFWQDDETGISDADDRHFIIRRTHWPIVQTLAEMGHNAGGNVLFHEYKDGFQEVGDIFIEFGQEEKSIINIFPHTWLARLSTQDELDDYRDNPAKYRPSGP
jgi:hypothetical protein